MSVDTLAEGSLNSFGLSAGQVQPEEQIFVLTSAQLRAIISQATAPLEARIQDLEESLEPLKMSPKCPAFAPLQEERGVGCREGGEELQDLKSRLEELEESTARERAEDRRRIARLERVDPQPLQKDRGEILRALIAANGGKMMAKDARKKMHLSESRFSELLATMKGQIEVKPFHLKKSQNILILI